MIILQKKNSRELFNLTNLTKIQQYLKYEVKTSSTALFKLKHKSAPLNVA